MMAKIAYSARYGGFGLSEDGLRRYAEIKGLTLYPEEGEFGMVVWWVVPPENRPRELNNWASATRAERIAHNEAYKAARLYDKDIPRTDPALIQVIEEMGEKANSRFSNLKIADVPSGGKYRIDEYDGFESVMTPDDYEWSVAP